VSFSQDVPLIFLHSCSKPEEAGKSVSKALGDPVARINTQFLANYSLCNDLEAFTMLARGYIFEGRSREEICAYNSGVGQRF
jgi:hypothetical protein